MSLDGQVLVIACFAVALNLLLWSREDKLVGLDVELDPKDVLLRPGWIGDRYV
jgi:hypothetical protein